MIAPRPVELPDLIPVRMLNEFAYCPRLAYLEWVQGEWRENLDTRQGSFAHRNVDRPTRGAVPLPDRPGQLARVSELLAQAGANVIEVLHTRHGQGLQISEVILQLSVETRGEEHRAHVISVLEQAGYLPTVMPD